MFEARKRKRNLAESDSTSVPKELKTARSDPKRRRVAVRSNMSFGLNSPHLGPKRKSGSSLLKKSGKVKSKKSIVIKPFKEKPKVSDSFERETVDLIIDAVRAIHSEKACKSSDEELYKACESLCTLRKYKLLFDSLYATSDAHIAHLVAAQIAFDTTDSIKFLENLCSLWSRFYREVHGISQICLCLDKSYVRQQCVHQSLYQLSVALLTKHMLTPTLKAVAASKSTVDCSSSIASDVQMSDCSLMDSAPMPFSSSTKSSAASESDRVKGGKSTHARSKQSHARVIVGHIMAVFESLRNGEAVDMNLLVDCVALCYAIGVYPVLESALIEATSLFYRREAQSLVGGCQVTEYLTHVTGRLKQEYNWTRLVCGAYSGGRTLSAVIRALEQQMVQKYAAELLQGDGFRSVMEHSESDRYLTVLFELFSSVKETAVLQQNWADYIVNRGKSIVSAEATANVETAEECVVTALLLLKQQLNAALSCLDSSFSYSMRKAFEKFANENDRGEQLSEWIAAFIDNRLRKQGNLWKGTEPELERTLDNVMAVLTFVHGKDVFEAFYKKFLAKRLLLDNSNSETTEKAMIFRCKKEFGKGYATQLENLFQDLETSADLMARFRANAKDVSGDDSETASAMDKVEFDVRVLTSGLWPSFASRKTKRGGERISVKSKTKEMEVCDSKVQRLTEAFGVFYNNEHSGRRLRFVSSMATCLLRANFPKGRKELLVSGRQACVLTLFNERNVWSEAQLLARLNCEDSALRPVIASLVAARLLLERRSADKSEYKVNAKYSGRLVRVQINQEQVAESKEERKETTEKVIFSRQYAMDAAIVRIMKARKSLAHNELMVQVIKQLRFDAEPLAIKKRIAHLIENEYLERDAENHKIYNYKA